MAENEFEIPPRRVAEMLDAGNAQVVDVREGYEHEAGRIAGSRHIELPNLTAEAGSLHRDKPVVFYCRSGDRSVMPAQALRASGWEAYTLTGGLVAWTEDGLPLEPPNGTVAQRRPGPQN
jgi:hydroxyacylglutathione hydrolase/adenylyltransferase/sulfurtransferase